MKVTLRVVPIAVMAICTSGITVESAAAQSRVGLGYVVNAPRMFYGMSAHALSERFGGIGIYVDAKFDRSTPRDDEAPVLEGVTVQEVEDQFGDQLIVEEDVWQSFNVALMRPVTPELILYAGGGVADRESYRQYFDPAAQRGLGGYYWVEDVEASGNEMNLLAGALFKISSAIYIQFGAESAPRGATVGAVYSLPLK